MGLRWSGFRRVRKQVVKRVNRRLSELALDYSSYRRYLDDHPDEWATLDAMCRVSISRFYRDRGVWERLVQEVLPSLQQPKRRIACLSLGAASGEEPYTLAMVAPGADIVAVERDEGLLARAHAGVYPRGNARDLPDELLSRHFDVDEDCIRLHADVKAAVHFERRDIRQSMPEGPFDLVLCRNLAFTYFDEQTQRAMVAAIAARLRDGGALVLGRHEAVPEGVGFIERPAASSIWARPQACSR